MNTSPIARISRQLRKFGPYYAMALLLPGGSLLAIFLWFYQNKQGRA